MKNTFSNYLDIFSHTPPKRCCRRRCKIISTGKRTNPIFSKSTTSSVVVDNSVRSRMTFFMKICKEAFSEDFFIYSITIWMYTYSISIVI
ncbi:hypothetical protein FKM82_018469 [Ascaphus truei]